MSNKTTLAEYDLSFARRIADKHGYQLVRVAADKSETIWSIINTQYMGKYIGWRCLPCGDLKKRLYNNPGTKFCSGCGRSAPGKENKPTYKDDGALHCDMYLRL